MNRLSILSMLEDSLNEQLCMRWSCSKVPGKDTKHAVLYIIRLRRQVVL